VRTAVFDPVSLMVGGAALSGEPMVQTAAAMAVAVWSTLAAQKLAANRHSWGASGVAEAGLADVIIAGVRVPGRQCLDRHVNRMSFSSRNEGSERVSMTRRAEPREGLADIALARYFIGCRLTRETKVLYACR